MKKSIRELLESKIREYTAMKNIYLIDEKTASKLGNYDIAVSCKHKANSLYTVIQDLKKILE